MTVRNSSTDSSSGSSSDSSSSSSSSSSGSNSSSSDSDSSTSETPANTTTTAPKSPKSPKSPPKQNTSEDSNSSNKKKDEKTRSASITKVSSSSEEEPPKPIASKSVTTRRRSSAKSKGTATVTAKQTKLAPKTNDKSKTTSKTAGKTDSQNSLKKKSIFSPDNSSESEDDKIKGKTVVLVSPPSTRAKGRPRRVSNKDIEKTKEKTPDKKDEPKESKRRSVSSSSGPPSKKNSDNKPSTSSCSSSQSSVNSDSDSVCELDTPKKAADIKNGKSKPHLSNGKASKAETSKAIVESSSKPVTRKLTRSLSARVSRLIKARPATDTDSETDDKSSDKKTKRGQIKSPAVPAILPIPEPPEPQERQCPVRGCDSLGHLGGKSERHFTWDACPLYHNVSAAWCVAMSEERQGAHAARKKALLSMQQRPRHQPTIDQRAYQLKVKDLRSKWRGSQELKEKLIAAGTPNDEMTDEREPILEGFVPDYDLRLFREAQAQAAIKIEEELGDIPTHKGTRFVVMGKYMMEVWYQSPYPGDAARAPRLFVCEFCLNHHKSAAGAERHKVKCVWRHPPGDEVYRKDNLSVWQVDGRKHKHYCQQLCLLAKFFLDHKTLYYDVEPFLFYVMTIADKEGCHVVGYFSKEKNSFLNYNVSCILTLPPYQRQGYGRLLIDFSYLLTKVEGKVGSPETPLSDLGLISYRSYWKEALLRRLCSAPGPTLSIRDLSKDLAIASCDIVSTLQERGLMKYWKGKHIVLKKQDVLEEVARRAERARCVEAACLRWTPPAPPPR